jgi:hypothetical protein
MKESREPTNEWRSSSNYDEAIHLNGGYTLALGYCYLHRLEYLFQQNNKRLFQFRTKWGWCGVNFLFSALRPDNILIINSWANSAMVAKSHTTLFYVWSAILKNILEVKGPNNNHIPIMIIDMPAAIHRHLNLEDSKIDKTKFLENREEYKHKVINPIICDSPSHSHVRYIDLLDYFPTEWEMIIENQKNEYNRSPWHISDQVLDTIFSHFLQFIKNIENYSHTNLIKDLEQLKL